MGKQDPVVYTPLIRSPDLVDLGRLGKPDLSETVDCRGHLRNVCGSPRHCRDLDDEYAHSVAIFDFAPVDGGFVAFLFVHTARRRPC